LTYGSRRDLHFTYNFFERFGTYYTGQLNKAAIRTTYRPTSKFSFSTSAEWDKFTLPQRNFSVALASLQVNYSFSRFLNVSTLVQMDTSNTQAVSANVLLRYQYRHDDPFSNLYVIYNTGTRFESLTGSNLQQLRETLFEIKLTRTFTPSLKRIDNAIQRGL